MELFLCTRSWPSCGQSHEELLMDEELELDELLDELDDEVELDELEDELREEQELDELVEELVVDDLLDELLHELDEELDVEG